MPRVRLACGGLYLNEPSNLTIISMHTILTNVNQAKLAPDTGFPEGAENGQIYACIAID